VTYTERFNKCFFVTVDQLETDYQHAQVDAKPNQSKMEVKTINVARLTLRADPAVKTFSIDGQSFPSAASASFEKVDGKWRKASAPHGLQKMHGLQGPIDDAFMDSFVCVKPSGASPVSDFALTKFDELAKDFPHWMRGDVRIGRGDERDANIVAFGTPATNPLIAKAVKQTPIHWTNDSIAVGTRQFDASKHMLSMIYPNPANPRRYIVINSGHTWHEADFKGTNVLLYPRVGDWAVTDISTGKVVAQGVFDRNWKLP